MPTCPNGHQSDSDDWCEVCGHRMAGAVPPPPPPPPAPGYGYPPPGSATGAPGSRSHLSAVPDAEQELCPQCRTPREGGAPFCEECRWNFLTNTATSYTPAAPRPPAPGAGQGFGAPGGPGPGQRYQPPPPGPSYGGGDGYDYQSSRPSQINRPAEPLQPFGGDPSRPVPPPPGPTPGMPAGGPQGYPPGPPGGSQGYPPPRPPGASQPHGGYPPPGNPGGPGRLDGAPQAFQPSGPPPPPAFPQETGRRGGPQPPGGGFGSADDDWVISPPTGGPSGPQAPQQSGGYGYPQPGMTQAPPAHGGGYGQPQPLTWSATIGPDREYFMAMMQRSGPEAAGLNLPAYSPEQRRALTGNQITIGRRRHSTGESPDIDLAVPPEDPGVSHQHAVLVQQPDGGWAVVDQNSTNGTTVNHSEEPIQPFVPVPLQDGDRVHVGAWTTITIRRG